MVNPVRPEELPLLRAKSFPDAVFETFNELIVEKFDGYGAFIKQNEVVKRMTDKGLYRVEVFDKGYLNIEDIYRAAGWKVTYDKPGYNETYEAFFEFSRKTNG